MEIGEAAKALFDDLLATQQQAIARRGDRNAAWSVGEGGREAAVFG